MDYKAMAMTERVPRRMATARAGNDQVFATAPSPVCAPRVVAFSTADGVELARTDLAE